MNLEKSLILAVFAAAFSYLITPISIPLSSLINPTPLPDGSAKLNTGYAHHLGGLGFFISALVVLFPYVSESEVIAAMLSGGAILMAGGVADYALSLPPFLKFFIQSAAALVSLTFIGPPKELTFFGVFSVSLYGAVGFATALFRLILTVNAVNFSDGLDGLASGLSVVALLSLALYGVRSSSTYPAFAALVLAAAVLGFSPFNRYRARVFMGNSGSQFLGLSIALLSLGNSPRGSFTLETTLFLAVPLADTVFTVFHKLIKGKNPLNQGKGHLHTFLLAIGIPHPHAVKILIASSALVASVALLFSL